MNGNTIEKSAWLLKLRIDLYEITLPVASKLWPTPNDPEKPFFNYRLEHVRQVERDALRLTNELKADREIVLASVWVHDRFQPAFSGDNHGLCAAEWAEHNRAEIGFPENKVSLVCVAVKNHSSPPGSLPPDPLEARLLWDADKLAHLGPFEILNYILNNLASDKLSEHYRNQTEKDALVTIPYLLKNELLPQINEKSTAEEFYFSVSQKIAKERLKAQRIFIECLREQLRLWCFRKMVLLQLITGSRDCRF